MAAAMARMVRITDLIFPSAVQAREILADFWLRGIELQRPLEGAAGAGAVAEAQARKGRGAVRRRARRGQRCRVIEVGGRPTAIALFGAVASAKQIELRIVSVGGDSRVHQPQAARG